MATDREWVSRQVEQYATLRPQYEKFARVLKDILAQAAHDMGKDVIVQARAKTIPSFAEKIIRKKGKYVEPVRQLTDLCGARVITSTLDEVQQFCTFIREHFDIDEANSLDVLDRLNADAFGYRSVHFVISLRPGTFPRTPAALFQRWKPSEAFPQAGPKFKAEIQVRTFLQHAWAVVAHDNLYKSDFTIPGNWSREAARIAALLEDGDESFGRLLTQVTGYKSQFGAYMTDEKIDEEIANLKAVLAYDEKNQAIARRIARLSMARANYAESVAVLEKFEGEGEPQTQRDLAEARIRSGKPRQVAKGRKKLLEFVAEHSDDEVSLRLLAECLDNDEALKFAEEAFAANPADPPNLRRFIELKVIHEQETGFLPLLEPSIESAIDLSWKRARLGIALPWCSQDIALLELMRKRPCEALEAFMLALSLGKASRDCTAIRRSLVQLQGAVGRDLAGMDWLIRALDMAIHAQGDVCPTGTTAPALPRSRGGLAGPVVIVAGSCREQDEFATESYKELLRKAFQEFQGTVICGGTKAGISGLVAGLPRVGGAIRLLSYLPKDITGTSVVDGRYEIRECSGTGFTPEGPLQTWADILASGIKPSEVQVLGFGGGPISAVEYRLAAVLGARVGLLRESGRAALALLDDPLWQPKHNVLPLPTDADTLRVFLQTLPEDGIDEASLEKMAKQVHENYQRDQKKKRAETDPALLDWDNLSDDLKASNLSAAASAMSKLRSVGLGVRRPQGGKIALYSFTPEQIEIMAELEHGRWNVERLAAGWRKGPRDHDKKTSPYLVPWTELPDEIKQNDRDNVRGIPARLKSIGYEVVVVRTSSVK